MDLSDIKRNDPCPCGSGKKFKNCHMGREDRIVQDAMTPDLGETARRITKLPPARHPRAAEMAASLSLTSPAGKEIAIKLVDLEAYLALEVHGVDAPSTGGGILINPAKTRPLDPTGLYIALSPDADDSVVVHQLAHAKDLVEGSALPPGRARAMATDSQIPSELLEHPQEFGETLIKLSDEFQVTLDADDEIVAFLARRRMLLPGRMIAKETQEHLVAEAEKTLRCMRENQEEINARIAGRPGYLGAGS